MENKKETKETSLGTLVDLSKKLVISKETIDYLRRRCRVFSSEISVDITNIFVRVHNKPHESLSGEMINLVHFAELDGFDENHAPLFSRIEKDGLNFVFDKYFLSMVTYVDIDYDEHEDRLRIVFTYDSKAYGGQKSG